MMSEFNSMQADASLFHVRTAQTDQTLSAARSGARHDTNPDADLEAASQQFESLLLNFMIREMRATVPESTLFPKSMAEDIFSGMLDEKIAGEMAQSGGIGISRMIFNQLNDGK